MKVFFKSGRKGICERGWYRFWAICGKNKFNTQVVYFRMPTSKRRLTEVLRARKRARKLIMGEELGASAIAMREMKNGFRLYPAHEYYVVKWLMSHGLDAIDGEFGAIDKLSLQTIRDEQPGKYLDVVCDLLGLTGFQEA